jgi:CRISPR-associated protein Cas1
LIYLATQGLKVRRRKASLVLTNEDEVVERIPMAHVSAIVAYGRIEFTTGAVIGCAAESIRIVFASRSGKMLASIQPAHDADAAVRIQQHRAFQDPKLRLQLARRIVRSKLNAALSVLHSYVDRSIETAGAIASIDSAVAGIDSCESISSLLGIEGSGARAYWTAFSKLNASSLSFNGRTSRPPRDPVNALLSFGYVLLANEIATLLTAAGFDACVGYYHEPFRGRPSLALDTMEPLRHDIIDRMVLGAINGGRFTAEDFEHAEGVTLSSKARAKFVEIYEHTMLSAPRKSLAADKSKDNREAIIRRCEALRAYFVTRGENGEREQLGAAA